MIDAIGRQLKLTGSTSVSIEESSTSDSDVLFVYYQGILAKPDSSSEEVRPIWLEHGDVMLVNWTGDRFKASQVVNTVTTLIARRGHRFRSEVYNAWKQVFGGELSHLSVDSAHNAYNEMPAAWRTGFREALSMIGIS
ncbi:hypothetical protein H7142_02705 [Candidatus Saccharibacteria bacterium]|nr:hypothetical protein [Candidatus Saccharibacteria bacterium]